MGNGIWHYTPRTNTFKRYVYDPRNPNGLRSNSISSIMEDKQRNIWFSTDRGGISRYNAKSDNFTSWGIAEGLPDDVTYDILQDAKGFLWFGTNKGLVKFQPQTSRLRCLLRKMDYLETSLTTTLRAVITWVISTLEASMAW